jgi:hypothetical protein
MTNSVLLKIAIEIVSFPINSMVDLSIVFCILGFLGGMTGDMVPNARGMMVNHGHPAIQKGTSKNDMASTGKGLHNHGRSWKITIFNG